jgi:hypothetical protein
MRADINGGDPVPARFFVNLLAARAGKWTPSMNSFWPSRLSVRPRNGLLGRTAAVSATQHCYVVGARRAMTTSRPIKTATALVPQDLCLLV